MIFIVSKKFGSSLRKIFMISIVLINWNGNCKRYKVLFVLIFEELRIWIVKLSWFRNGWKGRRSWFGIIFWLSCVLKKLGNCCLVCNVCGRVWSFL